MFTVFFCKIYVQNFEASAACAKMLCRMHSLWPYMQNGIDKQASQRHEVYTAGMPDDVNADAIAAAVYGHLLNVLCDMEYPTSRYTNGQALKCNNCATLIAYKVRIPFITGFSYAFLHDTGCEIQALYAADKFCKKYHEAG